MNVTENFSCFWVILFSSFFKLSFLSFAYAKQYRIVVKNTDIRTTLLGSERQPCIQQQYTMYKLLNRLREHEQVT